MFKRKVSSCITAWLLFSIGFLISCDIGSNNSPIFDDSEVVANIDHPLMLNAEVRSAIKEVNRKIKSGKMEYGSIALNPANSISTKNETPAGIHVSPEGPIALGSDDTVMLNAVAPVGANLYIWRLYLNGSPTAHFQIVLAPTNTHSITLDKDNYGIGDYDFVCSVYVNTIMGAFIADLNSNKVSVDFNDGPTEVTITFDKNDTIATGSMLSQVVTCGTTANLNKNSYIKSGWTFIGWASSPSGEVEYTDSAVIVVGSGDITLYAKWTAPVVYSLRDRGPAGGWVFYDKGYYSEGWRYMECAPEDTELVVWSSREIDPYYDVPGAEATAIGTGKQNTLDIVAAFPGENFAANLCYDYIVVNGGITFSDWYLPSNDELIELYTVLGGDSSTYDYWNNNYNLQGATYWSSTERPPFGADVLYQFNAPDGGISDNWAKQNPYVNTRAIRYF